MSGVRRGRRCPERGEPALNVLPVDVGNVSTREPRKELTSKPGPVDLERSSLPDSGVALEHHPGDGFEEPFIASLGRVLASANGGKRRNGACPCLLKAHGVGVAHNLPEALSSILGVDEESPGPRRKHPDAKSSELRVTPVAVVEVGRKNVFVMRRRAQYSFVGSHRASSGNKYKRMTPTTQMGTNGRDPITASE